MGKLLQIINNIYEYLISVVTKHLALISALQLMISGTNKGMGRLQWGGKSSIDWLREGKLYAAVAAKDIVSSNPDS